MKSDENKLLRDLIKLEIKSTPNKDFAFETIEKIKNMQINKSNDIYPADSLILIPVFVYMLLFCVLYILKSLSLFIPLIIGNQFLLINSKIHGIVISPVTIAITLSFLILSYLDLYLKKQVTY
jgi:hypothetical protein